MAHLTQLTLYPVSSYTFGTKAPKYEKDTSVTQRMERLKEKYQHEGVRRSVDGVLIVHEHNHPHVLLVQVGSSFFKLPGGRLRPGEDEVEGLMRKLNNMLAPTAANFRPSWRVGECLATYYRPNFENTVYPYCPPHVTRPKEIKRIWHVVLPERTYFSIPKNMRLVAVPLFEVYDNPQRYGPIIASIPQLLSRFQFILAGAGGPKAGPGLAPPTGAGGHSGMHPHAAPFQPGMQQQAAAAAAQQQQQMQQAMVLAHQHSGGQGQHGMMQPGMAMPPQQQGYMQPGMQQQQMGGMGGFNQPQQPQQQMGGMGGMQQGGMGGMPYQPQQQPAGEDLFVDFDE